jgi:trimeric autotransporter adhesin
VTNPGSSGIINTVAGDGSYGDSGDGGLATLAGLKSPRGVAVDASGNIYIADTGSYRIRVVTKSNGIITNVAGDGSYGFLGDGGLATLAQLGNPFGVTLDASGNIYIADTGVSSIRLVTKSNGFISTVAGKGEYGDSGDGGLATLARLSYVDGVAVDASGNIYIADTGNSCIRMVTESTGIITTVAGDGTSGFSGIEI